ncbi:hypothetical protein GCM10009623_26510 [Nocardioides aestuarii]|uniref:Uncharacterized protein n=1 Tax=Nocardioides aestuarii TaxID=252231 RepID=A0ABW4TPB1_9ACTN
MRTSLTSTAVALSAAALTVGLTAGLAGTANAERYGVDDSRDTFHGSDIRDVSVVNGPKNVHVTSTHDNLVPDFKSGSGGRIYLDTDRDDWGPEYVLVGGFYSGTDYQLLETDGFASANWGEPVEGSYQMTLDFTAEQVHLRVSQEALGGADEVRVAMRVSGQRTDGSSHGLVDWLGDRRVMTPWVAQG